MVAGSGQTLFWITIMERYDTVTICTMEYGPKVADMRKAESDVAKLVASGYDVVFSKCVVTKTSNVYMSRMNEKQAEEFDYCYVLRKPVKNPEVINS